jgi:hypothetical protein
MNMVSAVVLGFLSQDSAEDSLLQLGLVLQSRLSPVGESAKLLRPNNA